MSEFATRFDPALVSAPDASRVLDDAAAIEKMAATLKSLAAARVAETDAWKRNGERSAAHDLARTTGTSVGQAKETLETGRKLRDLPATADAAKKGELSSQQAAAIADAASADPDAEERLLETSKSSTLGELRDACARAKANVSDLEARRRRIHERRSLRNWVDGEGAGHLHLCDNPEAIAQLMTRIEPVRDELFNTAGPRAAASPSRHTQLTRSTTSCAGTAPSIPRPAAAPSSWPALTCRRCCAATRSATRPANSLATGPSPSRRYET
ncbi:MAG: DUF222 domain-containing protein [Acidimicrobiia bacterium]